MVKMKSGVLYFSRFVFFVSIFVVVSCSSIKIVTVKNSTNGAIEFRGQFSYEPHEPYNLDITLSPGSVDSWRYEVGYFEEKTIDKGLKKIILKNDTGCKVVLERDMIEKIAIKNGMWEININQNIMNCD